MQSNNQPQQQPLLTDTSDDDENAEQHLHHSGTARNRNGQRGEIVRLRDGKTLIFSSAADPERNRVRVTSAHHSQSTENNGGSVMVLESNRRQTASRNNRNQPQASSSTSSSKRGGLVKMNSDGYAAAASSASNWADWSANITSLNNSGGNNKKMEILQMNLPEDMRISKLLRRLTNEKNLNAALDLCEKLQIAVADPTNVAYIRRSFDLLAEAITSLLRDGLSECADSIAKIFGQLGHVIRCNFGSYKMWLLKCYKTESLRVSMMKALLKTIQLDAAVGKGELRDHAAGVMDMLKVYLEDAEMVPLFMAITETIRQFSLGYPGAFKPHFTDIVDIVVGWHLETDQTVALKQHCSEILQGFDRFWAMDAGFMVNLLGQFLEDIASCGEEILVNMSSMEEKTLRRSPILDGNAAPEQCFAALVGAFTSVLKCSPQSIPHHIGWNLLTDSFHKITKVADAAIAQSNDPELLVNINEFIIIVLEFHPVDVELPFNYIRLQLAQMCEYSEKQVLSTLFVILKLVDETQEDDIGQFIEDLFKFESALPTLRFSKSSQIRKSVIRIYTQVLNIKNVSVLQTVYNYILVDLGKALRIMNIIKPDQWSVTVDSNCNVYTVAQAETTVTFYLTTLSVLATSTSSIIAMWALQPSIIELLTNELHSHSFSIWKNYPAVQFAIITLLTAHCKKNNNFIASSGLLNAASTRISEGFNKLSFDSSSASPTTLHFEIILKFIASLLENLVQTTGFANEQTIQTVLDWTHTLLTQITAYSRILEQEPTFAEIARHLCRHTTLTPNPRLLLRTIRCLEALQQFDVLNETVLVRLAEVSCIHMCSTNEAVRSHFSAIFAKLPLAISLRQVSEPSGLARERSARINHLLHWFGSYDMKPAMRPKAFLRLMEVMQVNDSTATQFGPNSFETCWPAMTSGTGDPDDPTDFGQQATNDLRCLIAWAQSSAAQLCVDTKLRTPLGKAIDTFVSFERLMKGFARSFVLAETKIASIEVLLSNQHNMRVLLGFIEALEKIIYNAAEGAAFALPPPERPSRMFFGVNSSTCKEYFNRNRMTVNLLAIHGLDADIVIRNSEITLRDLVEGGKSKEEDFDFALINLVYALLRNGESDALQGLYIWCQQAVGRKFEWVQCAADQAAGRKESALAGYRQYLGTGEGKTIHVLIREFIADQVILCLDLMHDWYQMSECVRVVEADKQLSKRMHIPLVSKSSSQLDATIKYLSQPNSDKCMNELCDWNVLTLDSDDGKSTMRDIPSEMMSYQKLISVVENTLIESIVTKPNLEKLQLCKLITSKCLQECLRTGTKEQLHNLTIMSHMCHKVSSTTQEPGSILSLRVDQSVGSTSMSRVLGWCDLITSGHQSIDQLNANDKRTINDLHLDVCSEARKDTNYAVCKMMLDRYFQDVVKLPWPVIENNFVYSYDQTETNDTTNAAIILDGTTARALYEGAKFLHKNKPNDYACQFAATLVAGISIRVSESGLGPDEHEPLRAIAARTLLTLSEWIQGESEQFLTKDLKLPLTRLVTSLPEVRPRTASYTPGSNEIPIIDAAIGKLIHFSINQCPGLSKTWGALGNWCFRWGRKMVELRVKNGDNRIGAGDVEAIRRLLPEADEETITKVVAILNRHQVSPDDEEIAISDSASCSTEAIEAQLRTIETLVDIEIDVLHSLLDVWRQAQRNVYAYYGMSAEAYFKYLHLTSGETTEEETATGPTGCSKVTVTLRLLRLIVKHALGLQDVLEEGLAKTPTSPWKVIIPQLFSRLNHHEPYVRKRVSELLCRLAVDSPNLIIFPAVVGSNQEQRMDLADISMATADEELDEDGKNTSTDSTLTCCFNSLLEILTNQAPETVSQVQCLVRELKRVTLLWDELWLVGLAQTQSDFLKRLYKFDSDIRHAKVEPEANLAERYRIMLRPLIFVMERLQSMTCSVKAETNNERAFQRHFSHIIEDTLIALRQPFHIDRYTDNITMFKSFYGLLQTRSRSQALQTMRMLDISPILAQMNNTAISMPGVNSSANDPPIYIKSVNIAVRILPTKTKPKKLAFHGSDGRRYTYLFKGLEDLHLDERIMQFLSIANSMMNKSTSRSSAVRYRARNYSVIPLGSRSGLISWVDGVMPIFAVYKKYMMRESFQVKKDKDPPNVTTKVATGKVGEKKVVTAAAAATAPVRLCDTYLSKLVPRLTEHKSKMSDNRRDWPLVATRKVLEDLIAETPRDLLSKELWCNSVNSMAWRQCVRNFSHSVAVMSVIGYVIGLGDRHLDNILIDIGSGEVVHIDYNVCFEKGKTLRVPEKVPFRMTQNIEDALGVTGVEGTFRITCENVLATLKNGRETLLTLLEAFVYDPLVDWAIGDDGAGALAVAAYGGEALGGELRQAHKQLEDEVTRDTLALRFTEIRPDWMRNSIEVRDQLEQMQRLLRQLQEQRQDKLAIENRRDLMFKQLAMVGEVQQFGTAMQCHPINNVSQRYATVKRARAEQERIGHQIRAKSAEDREQTKRYIDCVREATKPNASAELLPAINQVKSALNVSEFEIVRQLLESSDQHMMYVQGDQIRKELDASYVQQASILKQCIEAIIQYSEVASLHATSQANGVHRHVKYADWYDLMIEYPYEIICYEITGQFKSTFGELAVKPPTGQVVQVAYQLIAAFAADKAKVRRLCERLQSEMDAPDPGNDLDELVAGCLQNRSADYLTARTLCGLNERLLMLEGAAVAAEESLLDMTTANGKWFMDEMCTMTGMSLRLCEMLNGTVGPPDSINNRAIHSLRMAHAAYLGLRQFHRKFIRTVLTRTMIEILAMNQKVLSMISAVSLIVQEMPPIETMMSNLQIHLRCSMMEMVSPHADTMNDVQALKMRLSDLKQSFFEDPDKTAGRLFNDFWALFDGLDKDHDRLTVAVDGLDIPTEWQRIDQIKESRHLAAFTFNRKVRTILEDISIVARFDTIAKTFETCIRQAFHRVQDAGAPAELSASHSVCDTDQLVRPVRKFIADYVRYNQLGVAPSSVALFVCNRIQTLGLNIADEIDRVDFGAHQKIALDELCRPMVENALAAGVISLQSANRHAQIFGQFEANRRRTESIEQLLEAVQSQQDLCHLTQRILTAHMWLHEEQLATENGLLDQSPVNRAALVNQMAIANKTLVAWRTTITKMRSETANFVTAINQRLKWAVGANPQLNDVLSTFTATVRMKQIHYDQADHLANVIIANCNAILSFERLRFSGDETNDSDRHFFELVASRKKSCHLVESCAKLVSPVEEALVELLDPEGPVDHAWLSSVSEIVNEMCQQQHEHLLANERVVIGTEDLLHDCSQRLRVRMGNHHRIAGEVKSLLRKILKMDGVNVSAIREYLRIHKEFLDTVTELHGHVLSKDFTEDVVVVTLDQLATVLGNLHRVFGGLFSFEVELRPPGHPGTNSQESRPEPLISPSKKHPKGAKTREKCNAYAMSVWRRIRMKLEGRDPDPTRRFSVAEQVDWMIREARNPDNLAVLYEGWAAWV